MNDHQQFESKHLPELFIESIFGPALICGTVLMPWSPILAASASDLEVFAPAESFEHLEAELQNYACTSTRIEGWDEGVCAEKPRSCSNLILCGLPTAGNPVLLLETMMAALAHEGFAYLELKDLNRTNRRRILAFLENSLKDIQHLSAAEDCLILTGWRRAPGQDAAFDFGEERLNLSYILPCRGNSDALNAMCLDLLFRQNYPASLFLIVDCSDPEAGQEPVPEDLWGMAPYALVQPALMAAPGMSLAEAATIALEPVETDCVVLLREGLRFASNHGHCMTSAMMQPSNPQAFSCEVLGASAKQKTGAAVFRRESLQGLVRKGKIEDNRLARFLAEEGKVGHLDLALASYRGLS